MTFLTNPHRFAAPLTSASYATIEAAEVAWEADNDIWAEGAIITITDPDPDVEFVYLSSLAVEVPTGLIPRFPFNDSTEIGASTVYLSEPAGDPDGWNDFTIVSNGTRGVDWELDTNSGRGRLRDLTVAGSVRLNSDRVTAPGDELTFLIADDVLPVLPNGNCGIALRSYNSPHDALCLIRADDGGASSTTNWEFLVSGPANVDSGIAWGSAQRYWLFASASKTALWSADGSSYVSASPFFSGGAGQQLCFFRSDVTVNTGDLEVGAFLTGKLTAA